MSDVAQTPAQAAVVTVAATNQRRRVRTQGPQNGGFSDNTELSPRRVIESQEYGRIILAFVRALSRRGQDGDIQALVTLAEARKQISEAMQETAVVLRVQHDYSWGEVGLAFGVTRQAARQRWGRS